MLSGEDLGIQFENENTSADVVCEPDQCASTRESGSELNQNSINNECVLQQLLLNCSDSTDMSSEDDLVIHSEIHEMLYGNPSPPSNELNHAITEDEESREMFDTHNLPVVSTCFRNVSQENWLNRNRSNITRHKYNDTSDSVIVAILLAIERDSVETPSQLFAFRNGKRKVSKLKSNCHIFQTQHMLTPNTKHEEIIDIFQNVYNYHVRMYYHNGDEYLCKNSYVHNINNKIVSVVCAPNGIWFPCTKTGIQNMFKRRV